MPISCSSAPQARVIRAARFELLEKQECVNPDVALGMILRRLIDAFQARNLRQNVLQQTGLIQQLKCETGVAFGEHSGELVADAFAADGLDSGRQCAHRRFGCRIERKVEAGSEADRAQHAQAILVEAKRGVADGANDADVEVGETSNLIDHRFAESCRVPDLRIETLFTHVCEGIKQQTVYGEIAALHIF